MEWKILMGLAMLGIFNSTSYSKELVINRPASLAEDQELLLQNGDSIIFEPDNKKSEIRLFDSAAIVANFGTVMVEGLKNNNPAICVVPISEAKDHVVIGNKIYKDPMAPSAKISYTSEEIDKKPPRYLEMFRDRLCAYITECNGKFMSFSFPKLSTKGTVISLLKTANTSENKVLESIKKDAIKKISSNLSKNSNSKKTNKNSMEIISSRIDPVPVTLNSSAPDIKITRAKKKPKQ
ncbi:MAG: hypothetical protein LBI37_01790 [Puniceicoccales bacterium]|jgi:hypothetical protein|nr:hypothetical protein [Puniceicoccales bacterium]